ncbi:BTB/POZ domain-containing protein At3g19850-like isoform X1 [Lycium barbarum]|uniref:BTB/POZ domain-containing protein At3g19850-like isoform X1 n=1 Tax=Lycium barbarum TaxID=112863 RepID=UPI00293EE679|nr:BTB/POZ domain-containing protein At3g19850-like isoform X1 [Lycium barbarum]
MPLQAPCDLQIHVNGQQTFFLHQKVLSRFSGKLRKIIKQEKKKTQINSSGIEILDLPGGPHGFELVSRFCYNNGNIKITISNVALLICSANFLEMTEKMSSCNLLHQAENFLEGLFYWSLHDIVKSLKSCELFFNHANSCGVIAKLMTSLPAKIAQNSDISALFGSSSSSASSSCSSSEQMMKPCSLKSQSWWFEEMTILPPKIIEEFLRTLCAYGSENNNLLLTRFLLYYLKSAAHNSNCHNVISRIEYSGLADTAVYGVVFIGKTAFSCRNLFWVLRIVSSFGISKECRGILEKMIGGMLDEATLDDILVCGHHNNGGVYDVNLVMRLIRVFVHHDKDVSITKLRKVARLIDKYLREIAPDQSLKISKFLGVAESLPDYARDCFDGVYRAIDIYLESHPALSLEERSRLCRCLNYEKLSLEACKDLAKNPRISPRITVKALAFQGSSSTPTIKDNNFVKEREYVSNSHMALLYKTNKSDHSSSTSDHQSLQEEEHEYMRLNLQKMQWRVVELEKICRDMKGQMSKTVPSSHTRTLPRLCRSQYF